MLLTQQTQKSEQAGLDASLISAQQKAKPFRRVALQFTIEVINYREKKHSIQVARKAVALFKHPKQKLH